jgi:hypothetical protein
MTVASIPLREPPAVPAWPGDGVTLVLAWAHARVDGAPGAATAALALAELRSDRRDEGTPEPIDRLSELFGLTPFDEDLLLLVFAAQRDAALGSRIRARSEALGADRLTPQFALALLAGDNPQTAAQAWTRLGVSAPLRRFALLRFADDIADAASPLLMDERIARFLVGEDELDGRLRAGLRPVVGGPLTARHVADAEALLRALMGVRPAALILGTPGGGRRAVACAVAAQFGLTAIALRPDTVPAEPAARRAYLMLLAREAILGRFVVVVDLGRGDDEADRLARAVAEDMVAAFDAPLLLIAAARPAFAPELPHVRLAALDTADRSALWRRALRDVADAEIEAAADCFSLGPADIAAVAARIAGSGEGALWAECRATAATALGALADRIVPRYRSIDLVLPDAVIADLAMIADQLRYRTAVFDRGGFGAKHARARGVTALFAGPSGTGKTMAAEVIAGELALDLYRVDLSQVVSKYIGETEKNLCRVFDAAEAGGGVVLFDECDALFGKRTEIKDSHDRYANVEISYLLQRMESFGGLAILATNLKNHVDAAFLRRIRFVVDFPMPDSELRRRLWATAFPRETATEGLDFDALARLEVPGGNIIVIAINAAYFAAAEARPVGMPDIARAAAAEFRKLDREFRPAWDVRL